MTISATDILVPVCSKIPLLYLLTQKVAQKFGYVLGIKKSVFYYSLKILLSHEFGCKGTAILANIRFKFFVLHGFFSEQKFFFLTLFPYICTQKANKRYLW